MFEPVAVLDFGRGEVVELAVEALLVEPADPAAGGDLEVVEAAPVATVGSQRGGVAVQLGLEQPDGRLGHGVIEGVADGADRRRRADLL